MHFFHSRQAFIKDSLATAAVSTTHIGSGQTPANGGTKGDGFGTHNYNDLDFSVTSGDAETEKVLELWMMETNENENNVTEFTI